MPEGWCPRRDPALAVSRLWAERLTGLHRQVSEAAATPELAARTAEMLDHERRAPPG